MLLEQTIQEVSNRCSPQYFLGSSFLVSPLGPPSGLPLLSAPFPGFAKSLSYAAEIKKALEAVSAPSSPENKPDFPLNSFPEQLDCLRDTYHLLEDQRPPSIDYEKLFSYLEHKISPQEIYAEEEKPSSNSSWLMSDEEARETVQKIQLSYLTGGESHASWEEKERFSHWQEFNKALLFLYESLSLARTSETNYSRIKH